MQLRLAVIASSLLALAACETLNNQTRVETQPLSEIDNIHKKIVPSTRTVPEANYALLWNAARGYLLRAFKPLDLDDEKRRVLETHTLEWGEGLHLHRTRITVRILGNRYNPAHAELEVVALLIEPVIALENASDNQPLDYGWKLEGNNPKIEEVVLDQIVKRYRLLREGRNPDSEPLPSLSESATRGG